ncbi:MAG: hypothetical protein CL763_03780 [Chloroflexi bacterium]|nr:hypothetical protein [Chloroflexota bacterium]|tara:strand:+ start:1351 stop:2280 length:930 start_codon:yes stop_codon:yes gene_type:complete
MSELIKELDAYNNNKPSAVAFGVFDGVHLGHQHVLQTLRETANEKQLLPIVVTLANHPLSVLRPGTKINMLSSLEKRLDLIRSTGVNVVIPITFSKQLSMLSPSTFMSTLKTKLHMNHFVAGKDVAIGHNRSGDFKTLTQLGSEVGYSIECVNQFNLGDQSVRSTVIREALNHGNLPLANQLLGRYFSIEGSVIHGEGIGQKMLGYPTANLSVSSAQALPSDGIYATLLKYEDKLLPSATSIGKKPTLHDNAPLTIETFIFDFDSILYEKNVELQFVELIRNQEKFNSVNLLIKAIERDVIEAKRVLGV